METEQTHLANTMDTAGLKARLDANAKALVQHAVILAMILKETVEEFQRFSISYIEHECIVGEIQVNTEIVDQDVGKTQGNEDAKDAKGVEGTKDAVDADKTVQGTNTEDSSISDGLVRFDIRFDALVPGTNEITVVIINVEVQVKTSLTYAIITRAVYYLARMISRQKHTVFEEDHYEKIRKVYSIWVCPSPKGENKNSIAEYGFAQQSVIGQVDEPMANYDKMKAIIINLNDDDENCRADIIRMLSVLLSATMPVEDRKKILHNDFNIPMTKEMEEEMREMYTYGTALQEIGREEGEKIGEERGRKIGEERGKKIGREEGRKIGREEVVLSAMKKQGWDAEEAMDILGIPEEEWPALAESVRKELARETAPASA